MKAKRKERPAGVSVKRTAPQTKAEMIATIQRQEAALFLMLKQSEVFWGADNTLTRIDRTRWAVLNELMTSLGITTDLSLPDNIKAAELITERLRKEQEA
jgi:hypothetical protein